MKNSFFWHTTTTHSSSLAASTAQSAHLTQLSKSQATQYVENLQRSHVKYRNKIHNFTRQWNSHLILIFFMNQCRDAWRPTLRPTADWQARPRNNGWRIRTTKPNNGWRARTDQNIVKTTVEKKHGETWLWQHVTNEYTAKGTLLYYILNWSK